MKENGHRGWAGGVFPIFPCPDGHGRLKPWGMRTVEALERRLLWGLDEAMAGRPEPWRFRCAPSSRAPLVAVVDYLKGYPCFWLTPLAFYREPSAALLQAVGRCRGSGKVDEIEVCLRHVGEPGRRLWFDGLVEDGFAHTEDGQWLVWRSPRVA